MINEYKIIRRSDVFDRWPFSTEVDDVMELTGPLFVSRRPDYRMDFDLFFAFCRSVVPVGFSHTEIYDYYSIPNKATMDLVFVLPLNS